MSQAVLADTGPLYAAIAPRDEHYERARRELDGLAAAGWAVAVTEPTVCETYTLVLRRLGIAVAHRWLDELTAGASLLAPTAEDYHTARTVVARYPDQHLTLFDALVAAVGIRTALPVWTYDHHFDILRVPVWRG